MTMIKTPLSYLIILPICLCLFSCEDDPIDTQDLPTEETLTWMVDGNKYAVEQLSIEATMTYTSSAHVNHLAIIGTAETGEVLTIYVQELFPGGDGSCLSIESYNSEVVEEDCHDDGFLIICDHGGCEYENSEAVKFRSLDEVGGFVDITSCDDQSKTISGDFELQIVETGNSNAEISISGSFVDLVYKLKE